MRGIVWFRRDLRLRDNPALTAACEECDEIIPLFVFDEPLLKSHIFGSACVNFMLGCLRDLSASLGVRGIQFAWRSGEPMEEVPKAAHDWKADAVYWNRDYEPKAVCRDQAIQKVLAEMRIGARTYKDHVIFEAEEVRGATGAPMQRYGAYRTRWWKMWHATRPQVLSVPKTLTSVKNVPLFSACPLPSAQNIGYESVIPWIVDGRNRPALDGSSKLSPHFRFGTLSPRTAVHAALGTLSKGGKVSRPDVLTWIDEVIWREFFQQVLSAFPHVADGPFRMVPIPPPREPGPERNRLFDAWCEGRTGYPIVDAGMRQLNQTGWMHNRVRMIVASFLIKDLRIDWQSGENYFMRHLLDADLAANNGNWQWCASTGTDAMRGYRIFNPVLQSKKFDSDGVYIHQYVPELRNVTSKWIHEPHLMSRDEQTRAGCRIDIDYPAPIVDHRQAREEYLSLGKQVGK